MRPYLVGYQQRSLIHIYKILATFLVLLTFVTPTGVPLPIQGSLNPC